MTQRVLKLALEALEFIPESGSMLGAHAEAKRLEAITAIKEALAQTQEPVADALHFAHWTTGKKDLSDYILVGSLTLAGIEDGEYGTSEIDPLDNTIDALQERIVTGSDHKKVPLLAYIGALKPTPPQRTFVGLTNEEVKDIVWNLPYEPSQEHIRAIEAKLKDKNT